MSKVPNSGTAIRRWCGYVMLLLTSRYGYTAAELADAMGLDSNRQADLMAAQRVVRALWEAGALTREREPSRPGTNRNPRWRYWIHPDLLRRLWETHGPTFEAMSAERANDRRRVS